MILTPPTYPALSESELRNRYDRMNTRFFNGQLPPVRWEILRTTRYVAQVGAKASVEQPNADSRMLRRNSLYSRLGIPIRGMTLADPVIRVSSSYQRTSEQLDQDLLHEMVHLRLMLDGIAHDNHGPQFLALAREIEQKSGIKIPVSHHGELLSATARKPQEVVAAVVHEAGRPKSAGFIRLSSWSSQEQAFRERIARMWPGARYSVQYYKVISPLAEDVRLTTVPTAMKSWLFEPEELQELMSHGQRLPDPPSPPPPSA